MDDRSLVQGLKKQEISAIEETIDKYTRLVSAVICNIACGNLTQQDVEEAVQDTFLSLWEHAESVEEDKLKAYLCQIAKNKARDALRKLGRNKTVSIEDKDSILIQLITYISYNPYRPVGKADRTIYFMQHNIIL